jgi:uncharacterized protein
MHHFAVQQLRRRALIAATAVAALTPMRAAMAGLPAAELQQLMRRNAEVIKVIGSTSRATFVLTNKSGQERVRSTESTTKLQANGSDYMRLTRFLSPADVRGTVSLMVENSTGDDAIWIYLPALKKVRRLASTNMKESFVGTDFANADVIGFKLDEWRYEWLREEAVDDSPCHVVEARPRDDGVKAANGYARRLLWIRKDNQMTARSEFWDEAGQPLKKTAYRDIQLVDPQRDRWQAMRLEAENLQTGHRTAIRVESFKLDAQVPDALFTARSLERE